MKEQATEKTGIVANGGWIAEKRFLRPRTRTFTLLSILWVFPSTGALWIVLSESAAIRQATAIGTALEAVTLEQWLAFVLLLIHVAFVALAFRFYRTEQRRPVTVQKENSNRDRRSLYASGRVVDSDSGTAEQK